MGAKGRRSLASRVGPSVVLVFGLLLLAADGGLALARKSGGKSAGHHGVSGGGHVTSNGAHTVGSSKQSINGHGSRSASQSGQSSNGHRALQTGGSRSICDPLSPTYADGCSGRAPD
jgi:hypothetical protein